MTRWQTEDAAQLELSPSSSATSGLLKSLMCGWDHTVVQQYPSPYVDDQVGRHMKETQTEKLNVMRIQKSPSADEGLAYFIITNP